MCLIAFASHNCISIHALREEGDVQDHLHHIIRFAGFLSTPSARRATPCPLGRGSIAGYFYPRPPRGGRPLGACIV